MTTGTVSPLARQRQRAAWTFLAPMLIVLAAVALWPLGRTIWFGFTDASLDRMGEAQWEGFRNYLDWFDYGNGQGEWEGLLADPRWWRSVWKARSDDGSTGGVRQQGHEGGAVIRPDERQARQRAPEAYG
jgi:hypothetical protein